MGLLIVGLSAFIVAIGLSSIGFVSIHYVVEILAFHGCSKLRAAETKADSTIEAIQPELFTTQKGLAEMRGISASTDDRLQTPFRNGRGVTPAELHTARVLRQIKALVLNVTTAHKGKNQFLPLLRLTRYSFGMGIRLNASRPAILYASASVG